MTDLSTVLPRKKQLSLFGLPVSVNDAVVKKTREQWLDKKRNDNNNSDYGTFKDSLRAPVHRWFKYPAGYSYRLVEEKIKKYQLKDNHFVLDPFVGSGTTSVECKRHAVNSFGIEAHPFVGWIAQKKVNWNLDLELIGSIYNRIIEKAYAFYKNDFDVEVPELVQKCYSEQNLKALLSIRNAINVIETENAIIDFFKLALIDTLRNASKAATGWPYIGPTKYHQKFIEKNGFVEFGNQVRKMCDNLEFMQTFISSNRFFNYIISNKR